MKSIRPMYIFTVLALLLVGALAVATRTPNLAPELEAILNQTIGGLIAMLGVVVNYEFGSSKPKDAPAAPPGGSVDTSTVIHTTATAATPAANTKEDKP